MTCDYQDKSVDLMTAMSKRPTPLFDTYEQFNTLDFQGFTREHPVILDFLNAQPEAVGALESYRLVRLFLKQYNGFATTYKGYRTHIERLLLWAILIAKKPILELKLADAKDFIEFCQNPPADWIGPIIKSRFVRIGGRAAQASDIYVVNSQWRPFNWVVAKAARKQASETNQVLDDKQFSFNQASLNQLFNVGSSFYQFMCLEGIGETNPIKAVKQRNRFKNKSRDSEGSKTDSDPFLEQDSGDAHVLSEFQWEYVLEVAEQKADEDPIIDDSDIEEPDSPTGQAEIAKRKGIVKARNERTLFIVATIFSMYLRVSDIVGRENWTPTMGAFRVDTEGNWWMHVIGKGNKARKISVKLEFIETYLKPYRLSRNLAPYPVNGEKTPLLITSRGRGGLSDRHIRVLVQEVFDRALSKMRSEGRVESELSQLRSASLHWLRHTSATFDAKVRPVKHLQVDMGHTNQSTTENIYYNAIDNERAHSSRSLSIKSK
jgi:site-specific recombinase XerD